MHHAPSIHPTASSAPDGGDLISALAPQARPPNALPKRDRPIRHAPDTRADTAPTRAPVSIRGSDSIRSGSAALRIIGTEWPVRAVPSPISRGLARPRTPPPGGLALITDPHTRRPHPATGLEIHLQFIPTKGKLEWIENLKREPGAGILTPRFPLQRRLRRPAGIPGWRSKKVWHGTGALAPAANPSDRADCKSRRAPGRTCQPRRSGSTYCRDHPRLGGCCRRRD